MSKFVLALTMGTAASVCALPRAQEAITVQGSLQRSDASDPSAPTPVAPVLVTVRLARASAADGHAPAGAAEAWSGVLRIRDQSIAVVAARSSEDVEVPDLLLVDLDADGECAADERMPLDVTTREQRGIVVQRSETLDLTFAFGGVELTARAGLNRQGLRDPIVMVSFPFHLEARAEIAGKDRIIAVIDKDQDGEFGTAGDMWVLNAPGDRPIREYGWAAIGERWFADGTQFGIAVDGHQIRITSASADGPDPADAAAQRERAEHIWAERFDHERTDFVAQRRLDMSRPTAKDPIDWRYVTFEEGLELAEQADKPLFVDVMAFWCVWCYRMDYYTYPDAEVAALLDKEFVPVKIIQEQDLVGDYQMIMEKLEARGIPAMGVFDAEGKVLHKIGGWKKPEDFVSELKTALAAR